MWLDAEKLEDVWRECQGSERHFPHKRVLHIGSESYDAQTITVIQGLDALGFEVCVFGRANINSFFCNKIISDSAKPKFDFILSSLHWGTRFSYYQRPALAGYPRVLIDGDDSAPDDTWRTKLASYAERYCCDPPDKVKNAALSPYRWLDLWEKYEPDVIFTLAAERGRGGYYIPTGIQNQWKIAGLNRNTQGRSIDFVHIPGPGVWREAMRDLLGLGALPGNVYNAPAHGVFVYPDAIKELASRDKGVHSYQRWALWTEYFRTLNDSKVLIHPGIDHWPFWESRRIYEGWACGCLVAMSEPTVDMSDYPPTGVCPEAVFASHDELIDKARYWHSHPGHLDKLRKDAARRALKYFAPVPVARYFLKRIHDA